VRKLKVFVTVILAISIINYGLLSNVSLSNPVSNAMNQITDFNGFELSKNSSYIQSSKSSDWINFSWSYDSLNEVQHEQYLLLLDESTNYYDFDIKATLDYNYTSSMLKDAYILIGSYYFENGTYNDNHTNVSSQKEQKIGWCGIYDAWAGNGGVYLITDVPDGIKDQRTSAHYTLSSSDVLTLHLSRIGETFECTIKQTEVVKFSYQWTSGLTRPLNYIAMHCASYPIYSSTNIAKFTSINATLFNESNDYTITEPETIAIGIVFSMAIITTAIVLTVVLVVRRRNLT